MLTGLGLKLPLHTAGMQHLWHRLWRQNPAQSLFNLKPSPGWILEDQGQIVGFVGNIIMPFQYDGRILRAGVATQFGVERAYRAYTDTLAACYFNQEGVDLIISTSTSRQAVGLFQRFSTVALPQADYQQIHFWILDHSGFSQAMLHNRGVGQFASRLLRPIVSPAFSAISAIRSSQPGRNHKGLEPEAVPLSTLDGEFDELWGRKLTEGTRLYAFRRAADLRWHFEQADEMNGVTILCCRSGGCLAGYLVLLRETVAGTDLKRAKVADLFIAEDRPEVIDALLAAAGEQAKAEGCHLLEFQGFSQRIRQQLLRHHPYTRMAPSLPYYYKAFSASLEASLRSAAAWYPTPYDGDSTLIYYPAL